MDIDITIPSCFEFLFDKARYKIEYDGKFTIPAPFSGRAEVTVYDTNGNYFDIPSTKLAR